MYINHKTKTDILLEDIKGEDEKEYMDYLIHNRTELTKQIKRHLDELLLLQKKLDIAVKALKHMAKFPAYYHDYTGPAAQKALKEIDLVGTSMSLAKEEV